jgi:hypothetical protein
VPPCSDRWLVFASSGRWQQVALSSVIAASGVGARCFASWTSRQILQLLASVVWILEHLTVRWLQALQLLHSTDVIFTPRMTLVALLLLYLLLLEAPNGH